MLETLSEGAALLMLPVAQGGAGFTRRVNAERVAVARAVEELRHWIRLGKKRRMTNLAGFIYRAVMDGDAPPETYIKWQKAQFAAGGGLLEMLAEVPVGLPMIREDMRQVNAPIGHYDEPAEDEEERPARPQRPKDPPLGHLDALARRPWRGHG